MQRNLDTEQKIIIMVRLVLLSTAEMREWCVCDAVKPKNATTTPVQTEICGKNMKENWRENNFDESQQKNAIHNSTVMLSFPSIVFIYSKHSTFDDDASRIFPFFFISYVKSLK